MQKLTSSALLSSAYPHTGIDFRTGTTVTEVDAKAKQVKTQSGDTIGYEKLILATGSGVSS